jgi:hypothetical protein
MSEYAVVNKVKTITQTKLNTYLTAGLLPNVLSANVRIGAIDPSVQAPIVIWIQTDTTEFEEGSLSEDEACTFIQVFMILNGVADATLFEYLYKSAAYFRQMIIDNMTLEGEALNAFIRRFKYYDTVEGQPDARAVEILVEVSHEEPRG